MKISPLLTLLMILINWSCQSGLEKNKRFIVLSASDCGIEFINSLHETDSLNMIRFTNFYTGGGVGIGDFNNDGLPDLVFSGNQVSSRIYLNQSSQDKIKFKDITKISGFRTNRWCGGISVADINQDGWPDIYLCVTGSASGAERANYLFINQGNDARGVPHFKESAKKCGLADTTYTTQAAWFDYDLDGDLDVIMDVNFTDQLYGGKVNIATLNEKTYSKKSDRLYRNDGPGLDGYPHFTDISKEAGIMNEGYSLGMVVQDFNLDGYPDIYIANDFLSNDLLYMNNGDGTFSNNLGNYFRHTSFASMGADAADYNNDGYSDIAVLDMVPEENKRLKSMLMGASYEQFQFFHSRGYEMQYSRNTLQLNSGRLPDGQLVFSEIGQMAGIDHTDWSWSVLFGDLNNNGLKDLMITNGFKHDILNLDFIVSHLRRSPFGTPGARQKQYLENLHQLPGIYVPNYLYENQGDLTFKNVSKPWGFNIPSYSNGAALCDIEGDGDLDIIINNLDDPPFIYQNQTIVSNKPIPDSANFLNIKLVGDPTNIQAIGSIVTIKNSSFNQTHQQYLTRGFLSSQDPTIHFGLQKDSIAQELMIIWPDHSRQTLKNIPANQTLVIQKKPSRSDTIRKVPEMATSTDQDNIRFTEVGKKHHIDFIHHEADYNDFKFQPLIPHKFSQNGPGITVGDVNGDGLEDFFIGGAKNFSGKIFLQNAQGAFTSLELESDHNYEDLGALFFDADNDGDLDLYVVSGGVENMENPQYLQDRLFVNDSHGHFIQDPNALPKITASGSCVSAADFDADGDLDLFVGGRVTPGNYPITPKSYLLRNDSEKGELKFTDVTDQLSPDMRSVGMVTSSLWTDFNGDHKVDLILAGEWMPITLFENNGHALNMVKNPAGLEKSKGWWNSIVGADFDMDGDIDFVVGNQGLNTMLKTSSEEPVKLYAADFDKNGRTDPVITYFLQKREVPIAPRDNLIRQLNYMQKRFPTYADYADAQISDLFSENDLLRASTFIADEFRTCYIENLGNYAFRLLPFPNEVQIAPVFGMLTDDYNNDHLPDILLVGNSYSTEVGMGWDDAGLGLLLLGKGNGLFQIVSANKSGFFDNHDGKSMADLIVGKKALILAANNNDLVQVFESPQVYNRIIHFQTADVYAEITFDNGQKMKFECYRGSGYLSGRSGRLKIGKDVSRVVIYDYAGKPRIVFP